MNQATLHDIDTHNVLDLPVFTARQEPVAFIEELPKKPPIFADSKNPLLSFATNGDGSAGRNFVFHDKPFYINMDRIAIRIVDKKIDIRYLYFFLHDMKQRYGFNHAYKANRHNLKIVQLMIPADENDEFDLSQQQQISNIYMAVEQTKAEISTLRKSLFNANVVIDNTEYPISYVSLLLLFDTSKGVAKYTKKYGNIHPGPYPVFSASSQTPLTHLDTYDYDGRYMTWATNGFAGTILILAGW